MLVTICFLVPIIIIFFDTKIAYSNDSTNKDHNVYLTGVKNSALFYSCSWTKASSVLGSQMFLAIMRIYINFETK